MGKRKTKVEKASPSNKDVAVPATAKKSAVGVDLIPIYETWVELDLKLVNWTFSNFSIRMRIDTKLSVLQEKLRERHGDMTDLRFYRDQPNEENEIVNQNATLKDLGFKEKTANAKGNVIYYDFKPKAHHDPLLLVTPRQFADNLYDVKTT